MTIKKYISGDEARRKLFNGMKIVADAVGSTAGPNGRTIAIQQPWGATKITKDGVSVAKSFQLPREEGEGVKLIIQASEKTGKDAGDGTTATCIFASKIAEEGLKSISKGRKSTDIKKGISIAVKHIVDKLKEHSKAVETNEEIKQVATISANGDEEIGEFIANAIEKVGSYGVVTVEEARGMKTELEIVEGMQVDQGYISPYFITNLEKQSVEFDDPLLFLYDGKINNLKSILPLLENVAQSGRPLVFIVDEIDDAPLGALIQNHLKGTIRCCVVKAPSFGDIRKAEMEDIATLTGGKFVSSILGNDLEKLDMGVLGSCKTIKISANETIIINGDGSSVDINKRAEQLKSEIELTESSYDKEKLRERLAKLTSGVAVIRVGAATEVELNELKDRVDDAVCATRAALEEGILPGGGISLVKVVNELKESNIVADSPDVACGIEIIYNTASAQLKTLVENAGLSGEVVLHQISMNDSFSYGYDIRNNRYCDLMEFGIIDATKVVRCAIENASSVASSLLTVEGLIIDDVDEMIKMNQLMKQQ